MTARKKSSPPQPRRRAPPPVVTTTTTTAVSPPVAPPPSPKPWWEVHAGKLIVFGGAVVALTTIWNFSAPFRESHLPSASQDDVRTVDQKSNDTAKTILKQLDQLDMRQQQSIQRGQNVANQLRTLRMNDLRTEISRLKDAKDDVSRTLLARDQQELDTLIQEANAAPMP